MKEEILVFSPVRDAKAKEWGRWLRRDRIQLSLFRDRIHMLGFLLKSPGLLKRDRIILMRYLNDSPSLVKSLLQLVFDFALVAYSWLPRVKMVWICHNLDAETVRHHPLLSRARRSMIASASSVVFVTDPLLLSFARDLLPSVPSDNLDWLTFGEMETFRESGWRGKRTEVFVKNEIENFSRSIAERSKDSGLVPLVGLCAASSGKKYVHFDYAKNLIHSAKGVGVNLGLIVATDPNDNMTAQQQIRFSELGFEDNVLFFSRKVGLNEIELSASYDFIFRGVLDCSVPITVYIAATSGKPLVALDCGVLPILVEEYGLGCVVDLDMSNIGEALGEVLNWEGDECSRRFLSGHAWQVGAQRLSKRISSLF